MNTLAAHEIKKTYIQGNNSIPVLRGVTMQFEQGTSYAITGPSGSGKSTLMHILASLDIPSSGTIVFNGSNVHTLSPAAHNNFLSNSVGLMFQSPHLIAEFSVLENVMLKGLVAGFSISNLTPKAFELLESVRLSDKAHAHPRSLSGGEQQRVALARALFNAPSFLLADEPTGNLDVATGEIIVDLLIACQKNLGMGIIVSSHDEYVTQRMDHVLLLNNGLLSR